MAEVALRRAPIAWNEPVARVPGLRNFLRESLERLERPKLDVAEPVVQVEEVAEVVERPRGIMQDLPEDSQVIEKRKMSSLKTGRSASGKIFSWKNALMIDSEFDEAQVDKEASWEDYDGFDEYEEYDEQRWESDEDSYGDSDDEFDAYEKYSDRLFSSPKNRSGIIKRAKQSDKHERIHTKGLKHAFVNANVEKRRVQREERKAGNVRANRAPTHDTWGSARFSRATGTPQADNGWSNPAGNLSEEERQLQLALERSMHDSHRHQPGVLSAQQIRDLTSRELTPEDYALLLLLDEGVQKKTVKKNVVENLPLIVIDSLELIDADERCAICMEDIALGDVLKLLPCKHRFHDECITQWLTCSGHTCPIDGLSLN